MKINWYFVGIIGAIVLFGLFASGVLQKGFTVFSDVKTQLKQDYSTYWASPLDSTFSGTGSNDKFSYANAQMLYNSEFGFNVIELDGRYGASSVSPKQNFYGKTVVLYIPSSTAGSISDASGNAIIPFGGSLKGVIAITPRTLDLSTVDITKDGYSIGNTKVSNPFYITINVPQTIGYFTDIAFIGYKSQFSCDLAPDEVWLQENFANPFSIKDLAFPPTKFCRDTRPFTLRDVALGETAIVPDPIPDFNRGFVLTPPTGKIITVNYATPNVPGTTQPCAIDQANVLVAGRWVCTQVIKTTTITRTVTSRVIVPVTGANSFVFTSTPTKPSFSIGNAVFSAQQRFNCQMPVGIDTVRPPEPQGCYSSVVNYNGNSIIMADAGTTVLTGNINVQYFAQGEYSITANKLTGQYIFSVTNPISIDLNGGFTIKQGQPATIPITIKNNLPSGKIILRINQKVLNTNQNLPEQVIILNVVNGNNNFNININPDNLGINQLTIQAFYLISADANVLLPSDIFKINLEISNPQVLLPEVQFVNTTKTVYVNNVIEKPVVTDRVVYVDRNVVVEKPVYVQVAKSFTEYLNDFWSSIITFFKTIFAY